MAAEEEEILRFLRAQPKTFYSIKEISRFLGDRRGSGADFDWAALFLKGLLSKGLVEANPMNHYRCKPSEGKNRGKMALSPAVLASLKKSGKDFSWAIRD